MQGTYTKFNGNDGYINDTLETGNDLTQANNKKVKTNNSTFSYNNTVINIGNAETGSNKEEVKASGAGEGGSIPQAFSHFTFEYTNQEEVVCDIQGVGFRYTVCFLCPLFPCVFVLLFIFNDCFFYCVGSYNLK